MALIILDERSGISNALNDGPPKPGDLYYGPYGICHDNEENIIIADYNNNKIINKDMLTAKVNKIKFSALFFFNNDLK